MADMEMKNAWTYFFGDAEDAEGFAYEWSVLLGSRVECKLVRNDFSSLDTYRFEAQVTQEQVDEYDMNSDWVVNL